MKKLDTSHAIATAYRGFEFRSRLEAKYAIFFDLCGWKWSYEPVDMNGWIPDFAIGYVPTLVEVKPFFQIDQFDEAKQKIDASGCQTNVVLFGADPTWRVDAFTNDAPAIGWLYEWFEFNNAGRATYDLHFGLTEGNGLPGLCPMEGAWSNIIWKAPPEGPFCTHPNKWSRVWLQDRNSVERQLVARWAEACNISKWVPINENRKRSSRAS